MAILIGFVRRLNDITEEAIRVIARNLLRNEPNLFYSARLPRTVLTDVESLSLSLRAEELVEGKTITPEWYISRLLARSFVEFIESVCLTLVTELEQSFQEKLGTYQRTKRYLFVAQIISSGIESCDKLHAHLGSIKKCVDRLTHFEGCKMYPWVEIDWKELHQRIDKIYASLMLSGAGILLSLEQLPASRYWPDFFCTALLICCPRGIFCDGTWRRGTIYQNLSVFVRQQHSRESKAPATTER